MCLRPHRGYLILSVPGLTEGSFSLMIGDKVILSDPAELESGARGPKFEGAIHDVRNRGDLFNNTL